MKQINDLTIKEVGSISSPTEVSVKMSLMLTNGTKADISIPVSTYYVAFSAQDEYDKWLCVVTCADLVTFLLLRKCWTVTWNQVIHLLYLKAIWKTACSTYLH